MENNEKNFYEPIDEVQKELNRKDIDRKDKSVTEENNDNNGFIEEEKSNDEQTKIEDHTNADFGFIEDDSNDDVSERCNESNIVGDDNDRNYKLLESEDAVEGNNNDTTNNTSTDTKDISWINELLFSDIITGDQETDSTEKSVDDYGLLIDFDKKKSAQEDITDESEPNDEVVEEDEETSDAEDVVEDSNTTENDEYERYSNSDSVSTDEEFTKTPDPVVIGHPIPTDRLNPELAAMEKERKTNQEGSEKPGIDIPKVGLFGNQPDYTELFNSYNEIIETLDNNINYSIHRVQIANRRIWISYAIAIIAILIAIIK